jgi:hypothetical protein
VRLLPYSRVPLWPSRCLNLASILYFGTLASFAHRHEIVAAPAPRLQAHIVVSFIDHPSVDRATECGRTHGTKDTQHSADVRMSCGGAENSLNVPLRKAPNEPVSIELEKRPAAGPKKVQCPQRLSPCIGVHMLFQRGRVVKQPRFSARQSIRSHIRSGHREGNSESRQSGLVLVATDLRVRDQPTKRCRPACP